MYGELSENQTFPACVITGNRFSSFGLINLSTISVMAQETKVHGPRKASGEGNFWFPKIYKFCLSSCIIGKYILSLSIRLSGILTTGICRSHKLMEFNCTSELRWDRSLGALLKSRYVVEQKDPIFFLIEAETWGSSDVFFFSFLPFFFLFIYSCCPVF